MGKLRIVQQNEMFRVDEEKEFFDQREGEYYKTWVNLKTFTTQGAAEAYAENYIKQQENKKPKVVKTYNF